MATTSSQKRKRQQTSAIIRLVILFFILLCVNVLASRFHFSADLTQEKRFTLSKPTQKLLRSMDDVAIVNVYLKGTFPAGFQRLEEATRERLQTFKEFAGAHLVFRFIDPLAGKTDKEKLTIQQDFAQKGIYAVNLQVKSDEGQSEQQIIPYALVQYKGREQAVLLLESHAGMDPKEELNYSESLLEFKFANAIHNLSLPDKPRVAYVVGNGETLSMNSFDLLRTLPQYYHLDTISLGDIRYIPGSYNAVIINKPTTPFADIDKFKIDQYIMNGGHVLWAIDGVNATLDSLVHSEQFIATDQNLNLDDMLFRYGVRINSDLIEDKQCAELPLIEGMDASGHPNVKMHPWVYFPLIIPTSKQPIVNGMDAILTRFASSIDTIRVLDTKKTILLQSSKYSRAAPCPTRVSVTMMRYPLPDAMFNNPYRPVAVLLEGQFHSVFTNRLAPNFLQIVSDQGHPFKKASDDHNRMIVISDGDIMSNEYTASKGPQEMGYFEFANFQFANKNFVLNCLEYLTDTSDLIAARARDMTYRPLDVGRVKSEKTKWQAVNIAIPIIAVLIFASAYLFFRKRRYETKK